MRFCVIACCAFLHSACTAAHANSNDPCAGISDEDFVAAFAPLVVREDWAWHNPGGPAYESWDDDCVRSVDELTARHLHSSSVRVLRSEEHLEYYETDLGIGYPHAYDTFRAPRCDYFDGESLAGAPFSDAAGLEHLTSFLDAQRNRHTPPNYYFDEMAHGTTTLNRIANCDIDGCTVSRCIAQHFVSCGSCERYLVSVESDRLDFDGHVELGASSLVRRIEMPAANEFGTCDPNLELVCLP